MLSFCEHRSGEGGLRIISRKALREFWEKYPDAEVPLETWYHRTKQARWENLADARRDFPHADLVGVCTVFNIKGNHYRLVTKIHFRNRKVFIREILTHREYSKDRWKNDCGC
ncbi:MAG TPA: type II toxin-antitoxin system HigB family toxin [Blastocatellia bacterium]|nr:type II toxin-antitoxin system HigB family toxin [Blastocatellia bacterium]